MSEQKESHSYEGLWTNFICVRCGATNQVEGNCRYRVIECDACGKSAEIV